MQKQSVVPNDICADIPDPNPASCASDAMWDGNWPAFFKWAEKAAANGDSVTAMWLAEEYENPAKTSSAGKNLVLAYMWYDIAAELKAREIRRKPAASNPTFADDNQMEINYRNSVGDQLTPSNIQRALDLEKAWFSQNQRTLRYH